MTDKKAFPKGNKWKAALNKYAKDQGLKILALARHLEMDYASVYSYCRYATVPNAIRLKRIERRTKGAVPAALAGKELE